MENYTGPQYKYAILVSVTTAVPGPPSVLVIGEDISPTNPVDGLSELGLLGWELQTTIGSYNSDDDLTVIHTLRKIVR